jgi:hypothetical protein
MRFRIRRPSPALLVAFVALMVALGGTSYAALSIPKNSIGTKQLKNHAVTARKINAKGLTAANAKALSGLPSSAFMRSNGVYAAGYADSAAIENFTSGSFTPIASKSFTAPTSGYALIYATLATECDNVDGGVGDLYYTLKLDGSYLENNEYAHELSTDEANRVEGASGAITDVVPVSAGAHTVDLVAEEGADGDYIESRQISILFVPNGSPAAVPSVRRPAAVPQHN